ncbi:hypothetical protein BJ684DRAFT_17199 [Piptocephalis cylindrospora]|uniref:Uncharacterized protein n=1 Tax=Piptocephalis cylindrospora TaxID=1907219 RepID=A0A4P9Y2L7_9FUNG|nr:hypothetical protein BJ684DRAFT_17199 [Piptocephalis cylindrospora]|eukprot:RKP12301.1 hypothetical protein BJ684DRAFT_17199 [Piptocephalis cylindrospora]
MSLYPYHKTLLPPSGVDHAAFASLVPHQPASLVVVRATLLQVFSVGVQGKLDMQYEATLSGKPSDLAVIRASSPSPSHFTTDRILLAFSEAKLSILEWDAGIHALTTTSLHYYQREDLKREFLEDVYPPEVRVDPNGRCGALRFYGNQIAILPFTRHEKTTTLATPLSKASGETPGSNGLANGGDPSSIGPTAHLLQNRTAWPYPSSFILDPADSVDKSIRKVIDMAFLPEYHEPTLAILYETQPNWTARLYAHKDTCALVVISLDMTRQLYPILYRIADLPYNAFAILPCPRPTPGICILTPDAVIHVDQGSPVVGRAVNGYAAQTTSFPFKPDLGNEGMALSLDGAMASFLDPTTLVLSLHQDGLLVAVELVRDGRSIVDLRLGKVGSSAISNAIAVCPTMSSRVPTESSSWSLGSGSLLFLGSKAGDSLLIHHGRDEEKVGNQEDISLRNLHRIRETSLRSRGNDPGSANVRKGEHGLGGQDEEEEDVEEVNLYGTSQVTGSSFPSMESQRRSGAGDGPKSRKRDARGTLVGQHTLRVVDSLSGVGAIVDMDAGNAVDLEEHEDETMDGPGTRKGPRAKKGAQPDMGLELLVGTGYGKQGALCVLQQRMRMKEMGKFSIKGIENLWTLGHRPTLPKSASSRYPYDRYVMWSMRGEERSVVLDADEELTELVASGFSTTQRTIMAGDLTDQYMAQVTSRGIRVLDSSGSLIHQIEFAPLGLRAHRASVASGWVTVQWRADRPGGAGSGGPPPAAMSPKALNVSSVADSEDKMMTDVENEASVDAETVTKDMDDCSPPPVPKDKRHGALMIWEWDDQAKELRRRPQPIDLDDPNIFSSSPDGDPGQRVKAFHLYTANPSVLPCQKHRPQKSGIFSRSGETNKDVMMAKEGEQNGAGSAMEEDEEDDIDKELYGSDSEDAKDNSDRAVESGTSPTDVSNESDGASQIPDHESSEESLKTQAVPWLVVALANGTILILSLPTWRIVFRTFPSAVLDGKILLVDSISHSSSRQVNGSGLADAPRKERGPGSGKDHVVEILMMDMRGPGTIGSPMPHLYVRFFPLNDLGCGCGLRWVEEEEETMYHAFSLPPSPSTLGYCPYCH